MRKSSTLARLIDITRNCVLFTGGAGQAFVSLPDPAGCTLPVRSPAFRNWFVYRALAHHDILPTPNAFHAVLHALEALASENPAGQLPVFRRVGSWSDGVLPTRVLLDLSNSDSQYVEISRTAG